MKTFYIAGSSSDRALISDLGDDLMCAGTWEWEWNWTAIDESCLSFNESKSTQQSSAISLARIGLVLADLGASARADLFVLHLNEASPSFGGAVELGTRLQAGKTAHVIQGGGKRHLFLEHPGITVWPNWHELLQHLGLLHAP